MNRTFLGIDLGTSAMKMVLIDGEKNVLGQITEEYQAHQQEGGISEIDPQIWYQAMENGLERLLEGQNRSRIMGIGVTGQMHTLVVLDGEGSMVRPAMMWNDTRTRDLIPELKEIIRKFPEGDYLSCTISTGSPAANLYWLKKREPEQLKKVRKFLIGPDYLVFRLTGNQVTDYCEASTSCLYQIQGRIWSEEMRCLLGLEKEVYPKICGSAETAGKIKPEIAERFGLNPDVQVITGTGDNPATAISTGCLGQGYPVISLGTSGVFMMPVANPELKNKGKKILFSFDGNTFSYLVQGVVQCNGNTFDWWNKNILEMRDFGKMTTELDTSGKAANSLMFYPHLEGDKTIYADPDLRGAFVGIGLDATVEDMFYAVVEGLCFGFRELADRMHFPLRKFGSVKVVGGGSKSPVWMQTLANVLDIRVEKMDGMIGPAFGIALLAAYNGGCISSREQISEGNVNIENHFDPDSEAVEHCSKKYEKYLRMRRGLQYIENGTWD